MSEIRAYLQRQFVAGQWRLGQLLVRPDFSLSHVADANASGLKIFTRPEDARELAKYDDAGNYRPLKTAPNLRHGWLLSLSGMDELRLALDFLYPAALGNWLAHERGELRAVPFRETLERQTGMYRVTQLITDDQAAEVIRKTCDEGCLRRRLWNLGSGIQNSEVLCAEACNLLVAACRAAVKRDMSSPAETGKAPAGL